MSLGDVATLGATAPIFVALLSEPMLAEPVDCRIAAAVVLGFCRDSRGGTGRRFAPGLSVAAVATAGAAFYALAMIWLRKIGQGESHEAVGLHFSLVAFVVLLALAVPVWQMARVGGSSGLIGAGVGGGGGPISGLGIELTYLMAILAFGERPTQWQVAGSLLVTAAG
jgi:drug/metabolite transporter (DMT)-like permease